MSGAAVSVPRLTLPVERSELACGATLLISRRPGAPICALQAHLRGGPGNDPEGLEGTALLTGGLADQGTRTRSEEQIAAELEPAGGAIGGDASGLTGTIVNGEWELLADLLCEQLVAPTFPARQVERQKRRLLDRMAVERDDPRHQGGQLFRRLVYGSHWLGRPAYGSIESVQRITPRSLRAFHARNWVGRRAVLAFCGDVEPARVRAALERRLARWKRGTPHEPHEPVLPPLRPRTAVFHATRAQVNVFLGHLGVRRNDPDYPALVVMDHVLGTGPGFTNRISRRLRDELGLAYSVSASIHSTAGLLPGVFAAHIATSPGNLGKAVAGLIEEIRRIQEQPVGGEELEIARSYLIGSFPLSFERARRRAGYMVSTEVHRLPPDNLERLLLQFAAVSPADVQRVARAHLLPDQACLAVSGPVRAAELRALTGATSGRARSRPAARKASEHV